MNTTSLSRESESNRKTPEDQGENKIEQKTKIHIVGDKLTYDNKTSWLVALMTLSTCSRLCDNRSGTQQNIQIFLRTLKKS